MIEEGSKISRGNQKFPIATVHASSCRILVASY